MKKLRSVQCACSDCTACCEKIPGMFLPGELTKVAKYMKLSPQEVYKKYCNVDYYCEIPDGGFDEDCEVYVIIPARKDSTSGIRVNFGWRCIHSPCIFYNSKKRCDIHKVKPFECKYSTGCKKIVGSSKYTNFAEIARHWATHKGVKEIQTITSESGYDLPEEVKACYSERMHRD